MSKDRFDLEQEIMICWNVVDDIKLIYEEYGNNQMSSDKVMNLLLGVQELYSLKFDRMFRTFEDCCRNRVFDTDVNVKSNSEGRDVF